MKALKKLPLLAWIIIAIASGVLIGMLTPGMISGINDATGAAIPTDLIVQLFVSFSTVFSAFLSFAIPLIIIGFIVPGIGSLAQGAGKMLGITVGLAYISSILAGFLALTCALLLYPIILKGQQLASFDNPENALSKGYISFELTPIMGVLSALILSFILGLGITALKTRAMLNLFEDFQVIVEKMLGYVIIPLLPVHIVGVFPRRSGGEDPLRLRSCVRHGDYSALGHPGTAVLGGWRDFSPQPHPDAQDHAPGILHRNRYPVFGCDHPGNRAFGEEGWHLPPRGGLRDSAVRDHSPLRLHDYHYLLLGGSAVHDRPAPRLR